MESKDQSTQEPLGFERQRFESAIKVDGIMGTVKTSGPIYVTKGVLDAVNLNIGGFLAIAML